MVARMSIGGGAVARRGGVALGVAVCLLLAACGSGADSDLDERVAELEQENEALRAQLEALNTTPSTDGVSAPADSVDATNTSTSPSTPSSSTAVPTTTLPPAPGSRENPHPLGEPVPAGDWTYTVVAFEPNVSDLVAFLSPNNEAAGDGKVYSRLRLRAVYNGQGAGDPRKLKVNLVSPTETIVGDVSPCCKPQRDMLTDQPETFAGGSAEGWIYYAVTAADLFRAASSPSIRTPTRPTSPAGSCSSSSTETSVVRPELVEASHEAVRIDQMGIVAEAVPLLDDGTRNESGEPRCVRRARIDPVDRQVRASDGSRHRFDPRA